jgi:hypothetical protein
MNELDNDINQELNLNDLEANFTKDIEKNLGDLEFLKEEEIKIGNPESIGEAMKNIVWEQFQLQVGMDAGESFTKENKDLSLDLTKEAHTQTTENFKKGEISTHHNVIDYQERYDSWQDNFKKNDSGEIQYRRNGKEKLNKGARDDFDKNRPVGSNSIHVDHTVSAGQIIRDPEANANLTRDEQVGFANGEKNLNPLGSAANQSKGDRDPHEWSGDKRDGIKNKDRFPDVPKDFDKKATIAKKEYKNVKNEGIERSKKAVQKSRINEAKKIGKHSLKAVLINLLSELLKTIVKQIVVWFKSTSKSFNSFLEQMKEAIGSFFKDFKKHLKQAADTLSTTIFSAIWGPIIGTIKKAWMFIKQGWNSLKEAIQYIRNPENKDKPISFIMLQVSKIIVAGLTVGGALLLGETIEKGLMTIPALAFSIPVLGSVASIMGIFLGALVSGIIGAFALNIIDRFIVKKLKEDNRGKQIEKQSDVINMQNKLIDIKIVSTGQDIVNTLKNIEERHRIADDITSNSVANIQNDEIISQNDDIINQNDDFFDENNDLFDRINKL